MTLHLTGCKLAPWHPDWDRELYPTMLAGYSDRVGHLESEIERQDSVVAAARDVLLPGATLVEFHALRDALTALDDVTRT